MDKSFLLTVGITCILMGMVYLFVKQKFVIYDEKISSLFSVVQTMADELHQLKLQSPAELAEPETPVHLQMRLPNIISVSDDSESEDDSDTESNTEFDLDNNFQDLESTKIVVVKTEDEDVQELKIEKVDVKTEPELTIENVNFKNIVNMTDVNDSVVEVVDSVVEVDTIKKTKGYSSMTVKELKKLVSDKGGPYLKTKPDLIFYLENTH